MIDSRTEELTLVGFLFDSHLREQTLRAASSTEIHDPELRRVYYAVEQFHHAGRLIDPVTIAEITGLDAGLLDGLRRQAPISLNPAPYVELLREKNLCRRAITAGIELTEAGELGDIERVTALAEQVPSRFESASPVAEPGIDALELIGREYESRWLIQGLLERADRAIIVGSEGGGKLLDVATPVLTTAGWLTMGGLRPGMEVFDRHGKPTRIVSVSDRETPICYRLTFDDGAAFTAGEDHLWWTVDYQGRQKNRWDRQVRSTKELAETVMARDGHCVNHAVACAGPVEFPEAALPVDPWLLGYWLGNGATGDGTVTTGGADGIDDTEFVWDRLVGVGESPTVYARKRRADGSGALGHPVRVAGLKTRLRDLGVLNAKRIPGVYLRASVTQRLELLRGLLDSDGYVQESDPARRERGNGTNRIEWCGCARGHNQLAGDVLELLLGLGIKAIRRESDAKLYGRVTSRRSRICFQTDLEVFSIPRKASRLQPLRTRRAQTRYVVSVDPVPPVECVCIQVDNDEGSYLVGREMVETHNSLLLRQFGVLAASGMHPWTRSRITPLRVLLVDLENSEAQVSRSLKDLVRRTHGALSEGRLIVKVRPQGMDLTGRDDRLWLDSLLGQHGPDLLCFGSLYKSFAATEKRGKASEEAAELVTRALDDLRVRHDCALLIEAHAPHGEGGDRGGMRPIGSTVWQRWPEIGLGMRPSNDGSGAVNLVTFRGFRNADVARSWPRSLVRGNVWPWEGVWDS